MTASPDLINDPDPFLKRFFMSLILPKLTPPITGHWSPPNTYFFQRSDDGYIRQQEICSLGEFTAYLLNSEARAELTQLSEIANKTIDQLIDLHAPSQIWLHPTLAAHLASQKDTNLAVFITGATRERLRYFGNYILSLGCSAYDLTGQVRRYFREISANGEFEPHDLRIISFDIQGDRVDEREATTEPVYVVVEYISTLTPRGLQEILAASEAELDIDPDVPVEFVFRNLRHCWW